MVIKEEIFVIKEVKTLFHGHVINDLNGVEVIGTFNEKELQKANQEKFGMEKVIKKKVINYMLNGKDMIIHSWIVGLIKKMVY